MKTTKTMLCGTTIALLVVALVACGTGAPARAVGDLVSVPIFGEWGYEDDSGNAGTSTITFTEVMEDGMPAWHITGNLTRDFVWGGTVWFFELDDKTSELFKSAEAISFMVRTGPGGQRYMMQMQTRVVTDYGHFRVNIDTVEGEAKRLTFPLRHFMQPAWAVPVGRLRPDTITALQWATHDDINPGTYDMTIWDIRLYVPEGTVIPPLAAE